MPCDLELFASLLTSILLFIFATPVRYLTRSPDMLFDKSWFAISSILYVAQSSLMTWHTLEWQIYIRQCHTMLVCMVSGGWLLEREQCWSLAVCDSGMANSHVQDEVRGCLTTVRNLLPVLSRIKTVIWV